MKLRVVGMSELFSGIFIFNFVRVFLSSDLDKQVKVIAGCHIYNGVSIFSHMDTLLKMYCIHR